MSDNDQKVSTEELADLVRQWDEEYDRKKLRRERPWTGDIIRVLWDVQPWIFMSQLMRRLWELRNPSGLLMPERFEKTIQSSVWRSNGAKPEDDLFYSPKGKRSGTWAVHREKAVAWLKARKLPDA
jgi:hypothetical protein